MNPRGLRNNLPHGAIPSCTRFFLFWRKVEEEGGRKERREKNAETVEYNSCQRPTTTTTMRCKQAFFSNQCAALIVASILWLRARAVCRLVDGKTIRKYEG